MSLSKGGLSSGNLPSGSPLSEPGERPDADGELSAYAPRWARDAYGTAQDARPRAPSGAFPARKVVPLRMPAAPQLAPVAPPAPARPPAPAPTYPSGRRPTGPELLAEDEVLKRLLQRHAADPKPLVARPARDPVGLALGMVARLIVAGCATAVAALLLLGVIPLPFRLDAASDTASVATSGTMTLAAGPARPATSVTTVTVRAAEPAPAAAAAAPSAQVPAQVAAAPATATDRGALEAGEAERLVKRGEAYLAQGDIAAARLILGRAAAAHDPRAALSLGATYDPAVLGDLHVVGFRPDVAQARAWYQKAAGYGSPDAAARLAALPSTDR